MTAETAPKTEAGRLDTLWDELWAASRPSGGMHRRVWEIRADIEAEAAASAVRARDEELRRAVEGLPWTGFYEKGITEPLLASVRAAVLALLDSDRASPEDPQ